MGQGTVHIHNDIIEKIDWEELHAFYEERKVRLEFLDGTRVPTVEDLKQEFKDVLLFMIKNSVSFYRIHNWIINWNESYDIMDPSSLEFISTVNHYVFEDLDYVAPKSIEVLTIEEKLRKAVDSERFEDAAKLLRLKNNIHN